MKRVNDLRITLCITVCTLATAAHGFGQATASLTSADSARIKIELLKYITGDSTTSGRVWLGTRSYRSAPPASISDAQLAAIQAQYPNARNTQPRDSLFLCGPGERVMMPLSGCQIRDDGIIVELGPFVLDGDSVRADVSVTQSWRYRDGKWHSYARGGAAVFERVSGVWRLRRFGWMWET
jgi:hypothetical protein